MAVDNEVVDQAAADGAAESKEFTDAFSEFAKEKGPAATPVQDVKDDAEKDDDAAAAAEAAEKVVVTSEADAGKPAPITELKVQDIPDLSKISREHLSAEERAAIDAAQKVLHRDRSELGRQSAYQRTIDTLRAENADLKAGRAAPQPTPEGAKPAALRDDPAIKKMIEDLPENSPMLAVLERMDERLNQQSTVIAGMTADQRAAAYQREDNAFLAAHPDFPTLREGGKFGAWIRTKPKSIQDIASKHTKIVTDAAEAIELVNMFKLETGIPLKPQAAAPAKTGAAPTNQGDKRQAQLDAARSTPAKPGPDAANADAGYGNDFESFARKKTAKRA